MGLESTTGGALCEELAACKQELLAASERATGILERLSEVQGNWRPAPNCWSVGECIDHLVVIGGLLLPRMNTAIERGRREGVVSAGPFRYSWPGRMFIESLKPSSSIKVRTVRDYLPSPHHNPATLLEHFLELQRGYVKAVENAQGLDLVRVKVASPANRLLRFSLGVWFAATVGHEQRHLDQAERVRGDSHFPA